MYTVKNISKLGSFALLTQKFANNLLTRHKREKKGVIQIVI